ncbi:unnamed protein product [Callosobruchus maculatus]|nr:unnamed protein product [Callosobruchus maculatus]
MADVVRRSVPCGVCKLGVSLLHREVQQGSSFYEIRKKFVSLCVSFKIQTEPVCTGFFDVFGPEVLPALNVTKLGTSDICRMVLGESCDGTKTHIENWSIDLPEKRRPGQPVFKILQISDPHLDPDYVAGSPANCEEPLCCREYSTPNSSKPTIPAGRWGTYGKCDAPSILLENMLEHIVLEHP